MIETSDAIEPALPAATIVLVRNGRDGLEALLVQRAREVKHMGGMWVFPGGKVDAADHDGSGDDYAAAVNAAIRETREEAGLHIRREQLLYLSHWTTPEGARRRFATWFFLALLEDDQKVVVDGGEIARHRWVNPAAALAESADEQHELRLMPPTFVSLADLALFDCCQRARTALAAREPLMFAPRMIASDEGICFLYEGDHAYESRDLSGAGKRHRAYMVNNRLDYIRD